MSIVNPRVNRCIDPNPNSASVFFCHEFINLSVLSLQTGLGVSFLSLLFSGKRQPSLRTIERVSEALGMGIEEFVKGLRDHTQTAAIRKQRRKIA